MYELIQTHDYDGCGIRRLSEPVIARFTDFRELQKYTRKLRKRGLTSQGGRHYKIYLRGELDG